MSGPFGAGALQYFSGAKPFYDYEIEQSLRFNNNDSAYLQKTFSATGNVKTFTISFSGLSGAEMALLNTCLLVANLLMTAFIWILTQAAHSRLRQRTAAAQ